ncbi:hypothetical protein ACFLZW_02885 [Chloroflexota bacterium]
MTYPGLDSRSSTNMMGETPTDATYAYSERAWTEFNKVDPPAQATDYFKQIIGFLTNKPDETRCLITRKLSFGTDTGIKIYDCLNGRYEKRIEWCDEVYGR